MKNNQDLEIKDALNQAVIELEKINSNLYAISAELQNQAETMKKRHLHE